MPAVAALKCAAERVSGVEGDPIQVLLLAPDRQLIGNGRMIEHSQPAQVLFGPGTG
jgi:hypothetical protein